MKAAGGHDWGGNQRLDLSCDSQSHRFRTRLFVPPHLRLVRRPSLQGLYPVTSGRRARSSLLLGLL